MAAHQFVCWVAGGAVRDLYLGRKVYDFDLVTDASTEALKQIFPEAVLVGESFGVLKIPVSNGELFDLATFRQESDYSDGRRPSTVNSSTPFEDAQRRDFTINALFWDDESGRLIDFIGGVKDLNLQTLRCVGDAVVRFTEDHLRIVRLIRFTAQLHFKIEEATELAAFKFIPKIQSVSGERIWAELKKIAEARSWDFTLNSKLFSQFLLEIFKAPLKLDFLKKHNISTIESFELEALFFILINLDADANETKKILASRLKLSKAELSIYELIQFALTQLIGKSVYEICLQFEKKEGLKKVLQFLVQLGISQKELVNECENLLDKYPVAVLSGHDLMSMLKGPEIGSALDEIRLLQFQGKIASKDDAMKLIVMKKSP
ncbi:MAG: CCA tRNA nucleotidyltransferase [Bdellovibrio sp.]|nr:CCA tRNA nucleotidyltransferase [Bdellovibrio sp.]